MSAANRDLQRPSAIPTLHLPELSMGRRSLPNPRYCVPSRVPARIWESDTLIVQANSWCVCYSCNNRRVQLLSNPCLSARPRHHMPQTGQQYGHRSSFIAKTLAVHFERSPTGAFTPTLTAVQSRPPPFTDFCTMTHSPAGLKSWIKGMKTYSGSRWKLPPTATGI